MITRRQLLDDLTILRDECADAQDMIDRARLAHPQDKLFNLQLDVKQTALDEKKRLFENAERLLK